MSQELRNNYEVKMAKLGEEAFVLGEVLKLTESSAPQCKGIHS